MSLVCISRKWEVGNGKWLNGCPEIAFGSQGFFVCFLVYFSSLLGWQQRGEKESVVVTFPVWASLAMLTHLVTVILGVKKLSLREVK